MKPMIYVANFARSGASQTATRDGCGRVSSASLIVAVSR
jgi:hypothetical protein